MKCMVWMSPPEASQRRTRVTVCSSMVKLEAVMDSSSVTNVIAGVFLHKTKETIATERSANFAGGDRSWGMRDGGEWEG